MSIVARVNQLVVDGRLILRPSTFLDISARNMYLTPYIDALAKAPFADTIDGERHAALSEYLNAFAELNAITVSQNPDRKPSDVMLARVHPVGKDFWSMRICHPENTSGVRVLGAFCAKDAFIGLSCEFREHMNDFNNEVNNATEIWGDLFGNLQPHSGRSLDDYLTNYREF